MNWYTSLLWWRTVQELDMDWSLCRLIDDYYEDYTCLDESIESMRNV